ncbi:CotH kinase family protein [Candidatus Pelagibacter communis]|uniref:CotH kinase family protein n=1 Tax=Pelagibacter ubique TaxID=198252 RepID=UPI00094BF09F|nr:CotH kinase family protein [Candidatus Pelagibacter ubique]
MLIKFEKNNKKKIKKDFSKSFLKYYFLITSSALIVLIFLILQTGYWGNYKKTFLDRFYKSSFNNYLKLPIIFPQIIYGFFVDVPVVNLNISLNKLLILDDDRNKALENNNAFKFEFRKVPASINFGNSEYKIDVRLKGDRDIHYKDIDKSSYKIELENNETIIGMNKFSLMKPRARNYIHEWIYHQLMAEGGLISLKYEFINLKINGESKGLYVIEEGFDKILIERNQRRNGPIFALKEEWAYQLNNDENKDPIFQVYNKRNWLKDENLQLTLYANKLLNDFFKKKKKLEEIFDVEKWAWFMAVSDLNYYAHGSDIKSVKFYFNPLSKKFEPVPFDGHRVVVDLNKNIIGWQNYRNSKPSFKSAISCIENFETCPNPFSLYFFFNVDGSLNKVFFDKYRQNLEKITSSKYLDNFFQERSQEIFRYNSKIYSDYFYVDNTYYYGPGLYYFDKNEIYKRAKRLKSQINSIPSNIIVSQQNDKIYVKNWNISNNTIFNNHNLVIKKVNCINKLTGKEDIFEMNLGMESFENIIYLKKNDLKCNSINIYDEISDENFNVKTDFLYKEYKGKKKFSNGNYLDYFVIENDKLFLKHDEIKIRENLYIPKGFKVSIKPSQKIYLLDNAFLISESPFIANGGDKDNKTKIEIGGTEKNTGGGIYIKDTNHNNFFQNVVFKNLNGNRDFIPEGYVIYGAVNFFNSTVSINNFSFENINSEDAINFVSSNIAVTNGVFKNIKSDAIDVDHGNGIINKLKIQNVLNDGIDFSESRVKVSEVYFENIGDKSVSVGENSEIEINNINISDSYLGVVSKDGSTVNGKNIKNFNVTVPYASYIKKKEYKGPILKIVGAQHEGHKKLYLKDKFANITIDKEKKIKTTKNILELIYNPDKRLR